MMGTIIQIITCIIVAVAASRGFVREAAIFTCSYCVGYLNAILRVTEIEAEKPKPEPATCGCQHCN